MCSASQNVDTEMGQAPCPKRDLETHSTHGLQIWQRGLCVHTSSKLRHNPSPVKRGTVVAVNCCVRKARFFRFPNGLWNRTREALALCGIQHHKGETLFVLFPDPTIVGLTPTVNVPENITKQISSPSYSNPRVLLWVVMGWFLLASYAKKT